MASRRSQGPRDQPVRFIERPKTPATPARPKASPQGRPWWAKKRITFGTLGTLLTIAGLVTAAIVIQLDSTVTSTSQVSDVQFADGGGGLAGFATMSLGTDGATATLTLTPVSGATMQVSDMLQIQNTDVSQNYTVSLGRSAAPDSDITSLTFTVFDDLGSQVDQYDAVGDSGSGFTLPAGDTYDVRIDMTVADGQGTNSLGSFDLQFSVTPA